MANTPEKAVPIINVLYDWMLAQRDLVPNGSVRAKVLDYSLKRWVALTHYLEDGTVPIDNSPRGKPGPAMGAWSLELVVCWIAAQWQAGCGDHEFYSIGAHEWA